MTSPYETHLTDQFGAASTDVGRRMDVLADQFQDSDIVPSSPVTWARIHERLRSACPHLTSPTPTHVVLAYGAALCDDCLKTYDPGSETPSVPEDCCDRCLLPATGGKFYEVVVSLGAVILYANVCEPCRTAMARGESIFTE